MAQSDSVYDIIDPADHFIMKGNLVPITTTDTGNLHCWFDTSFQHKGIEMNVICKIIIIFTLFVQTGSFAAVSALRSL